MIYQAHMATNPNGGTFMVLTPCIIQNPIVYSYRPVQNFVPVNNNYIQFQPNHMQVINQPYIEQPYMIPSNMMNYRGIVTQSLSTNYNTINNNVYNSINTIGTEDVSSTNILNVNSSSSHAFDAGQEKNCGLLPKPDMDVEQTLNGKNLPDGEEK